MAIGPFSSYAPPGVYTSTVQEPALGIATQGLRLPVFIGTGKEVIRRSNLTVTRGLSGSSDTPVYNEDVSSQWVVSGTFENPVLGLTDGNKLSFQVLHYPIVDGNGTSTVTNDPAKVSVTVNGEAAVVGQVDGQNGVVTLVNPPSATDFVVVSYYFDRKDTLTTDDVSDQVTGVAAILKGTAGDPYAAFTTDKVLELYVNDSISPISVKITGDSGGLTLTAVVTALNNNTTFSGAGVVASAGKTINDLDVLVLTSSNNLKIGSGTANTLLGFTENQSSNRNKVFTVFNAPVVSGDNTGTATTDTSKVVAKVNAQVVTVSAVDGRTGKVTLAKAPAVGETVEITYWFNTWQDTFDYLPDSNVIFSTSSAGVTPGSNTYSRSYVIKNYGAQSRILWGAAFTVDSVLTTGTTAFSSSQITGSLVDSRWFGAACTSVSASKWQLPVVPTAGDGLNNPTGQAVYSSSSSNGRIELPTKNPSFITAYVGLDWNDAYARGPVEVLEIEGRTITLKSPVTAGYSVFATQYYNLLSDATYTLTSIADGPSGSGQYSITSNGQALYGVTFAAGTSTVDIEWPSGVQEQPDAFVTGGVPVNETVTVEFVSNAATHATVIGSGGGYYDLYDPGSNIFGDIDVNGVTLSVDLSSAYKPSVVGQVVDLAVSLSGTQTMVVEIDGVEVPISFNGSSVADVDDIIGEINTDINNDTQTHSDGTATFAATSAGQTLATAYAWSATQRVVKISGRNTQSSTNGQFSNVRIVDGTPDLLAALGLEVEDKSTGGYNAVNRAAEVAATVDSGWAWTDGENDKLILEIDGVEKTITFASGDTTISAIRSKVNTAFSPNTVAVTVIGYYTNKLFLRSPSVGSASKIIVKGTSTALTVLGLTAGTYYRTQANASVIAAALNADAAFDNEAVAWPYVDGSNTYLKISSLNSGTSSTIEISPAAADTALQAGTGIGLDATYSDTGSAAFISYEVTSSNASGSAGTGLLDQTYVDAQTGLRFTVLTNPDAAYVAGETFLLNVSETFTANSGIPTYAVPGLELLVSNTVGVAAGSTASLVTYDPDGLEPSLGQIYYVTYDYLKSDFSAKVFTEMRPIIAQYGDPTPDNPVSYAAQLAFFNGAAIVGIKQVAKIPGQSTATTGSYIDAIDSLRKPIQGRYKADIIVPLGTDPTIYTYLSNHCSMMSSPIMESERTGVVGVAAGTTPAGVQQIARGLASELMTVVYPDTFVAPVRAVNGTVTNRLVDGTFAAAALASTTCNPGIDVATPWTRRAVGGISSVGRQLDPVEANAVAVSGVTVLEQVDTGVRVRHGLTTKVDNVINRTPSVQLIIQSVQKNMRATLDVFIGQKFTSGLTGQVTSAIAGLFQTLISNQIVTSVQDIIVEQDASDPTILNVSLAYVPIFPLEYIVVTMQVRVRA